ncbi:MAG: hypothetical protein BMS9Abin23_1009 [Thermodesulfobacteriota bacterium]|nr:MAG: hypothetical protein BMS9Abin23_1009 [Thermodesulfobacteriota bacterium]
MKIDPLIKLLIVLASTPLLLAILHAISSRAIRRLRPSTSNHAVVLAAIGLGHLFILPFFLYLSLWGGGGFKAGAAGMAYSVVIYEALAYSYFHIFNMSETARRIRILHDIYSAGRLKVSGVSASYNAEEMLANRLERLVAMRQIRSSGQLYVLDSRLLYYAAKITSAWGAVLGLPGPESVYRKRRRNAP